LSSAPATPLPYSPDAVEHARLRVRDDSTDRERGSKPYYIPVELATAARIVAESTDNTPSGNHSDVAATIRHKYGKGKRYTNKPQQALLRSNGLSDFQSNAEPTNASMLEQDQNGHATLQKRAPSKYWMPHMEKNGHSPYAPDGYKVHQFVPFDDACPG
jgi:hypothetical protein